MTVKRAPYAFVILLILILSALSGITSTANAQKIHALLIIMDDDLDIRQIVDINRLRIKKTLQLLDITPEIWQADARQIRPEHISKWVRNRRVALEDTIFVYYSGHGHIDRKARHFLDLDVQNAALSLLRSDLVKELSQKRCRLKMLITDTCSNQVQTSPPRATSSATVVSKKRRYTQNLFLKHSGFLDITAASPGQYAWGNNQIGGYFTFALIDSFTASSDKDEDGFLSWGEVFSTTQKETEQLFSKTIFLSIDKQKMDKIGQKTQIPKKYSLPKPIRGTGVPGSSDFIIFGHKYSREEVDGIIFLSIIFGGIVCILVLIYFLLSLFKKVTKVNETTERNSTSENNLRAKELRSSSHNLSLAENNLRKQLKNQNISQQQKESLKKQLKETLTQLEENVSSQLKNRTTTGPSTGHLNRQLKNIRKRKRNVK